MMQMMSMMIATRTSPPTTAEPMMRAVFNLDVDIIVVDVVVVGDVVVGVVVVGVFVVSSVIVTAKDR